MKGIKQAGAGVMQMRVFNVTLARELFSTRRVREFGMLYHKNTHTHSLSLTHTHTEYVCCPEGKQLIYRRKARDEVLI